MMPAQVQALQFFTEKEKTLTGALVDWEGYDAQTMQAMDALRQQIQSPIILIRGGKEHGPKKLTCVDAVANAPFPLVVMALMRLQHVSWGIYEGRSFHLDMRPFTIIPARWMAVHNNQLREQAMYRKGLGELITGRTDRWIYLAWNHPKSYEALTYLVSINTSLNTKLSRTAQI